MLIVEKQLSAEEKEKLNAFNQKFKKLMKEKEKIKLKLKQLDLKYLELQIEFFETFEKEILKNITNNSNRLVFDLDMGFLFVEESGEFKL